MVGLNVGVLLSDVLEHIVEGTIGELHYVILRDAGDLFAAMRPRIVKGIADDALGAGNRDQLDAL